MTIIMMSPAMNMIDFIAQTGENVCSLDAFLSEEAPGLCYRHQVAANIANNKTILNRGSKVELWRDHKISGAVDITILTIHLHGGQTFVKLPGKAIKLRLNYKVSLLINIAALAVDL